MGIKQVADLEFSDHPLPLVSSQHWHNGARLGCALTALTLVMLTTTLLLRSRSGVSHLHLWNEAGPSLDASTEPKSLRAPPARGVSIAMASYRRAEVLKLFIPRYLNIPIVREIVICDDANSGDAVALRLWLPTTDIPPADQARVRIFDSESDVRLGGFRNKVRCLSLAQQDWVSLIDSDNFASPEHYWGPLSAFWNATYGAVPPPPGAHEAERRVMSPSAWMVTDTVLGPPRIVESWHDIGSVCDNHGEPGPLGLDPLGAVGLGCWEAAFRLHDVFVSR